MHEKVKLGCLGLGRLGYQHAKNIATRIKMLRFKQFVTLIGRGLWK